MGPTQLDRSKHILRETSQVRDLRRMLDDPDLVTFFNVETGQWILAYWLDKSKGRVDEIDDLGPNFELLTRSFVESLRQSRRATDFKDLKRGLQRAARTKHLQWQDEMEEQQDHGDYFRRCGVRRPYFV